MKYIYKGKNSLCCSSEGKIVHLLPDNEVSFNEEDLKYIDINVFEEVKETKNYKKKYSESDE
jgi:hypothetical protein